MKSSTNTKLYQVTLIAGAIYLVAALFQEYLVIWQNGIAGIPSPPDSLNGDQTQLTLLIIPEIILFVYICLRLGRKISNVGKTIAAAIGYPIAVFGLGYLAYLSNISYLMLLLFGCAVLIVPLPLLIIGLYKRDDAMTLVAFMTFNIAYVWYTLGLYTGNSGDMPFTHSAFFVLPLMLLVIADLVAQRWPGMIHAQRQA